MIIRPTPKFQLTHPWGCDVTTTDKTVNTTISTHTPVRVWLLNARTPAPSGGFQLTHPWGCDFSPEKFIVPLIGISTHTPVRVWLLFVYVILYSVFISTHTPVRVWPEPEKPEAPHFSISTHTPVRVWPVLILHRPNVQHFNSHTREGVTDIHFHLFQLKKFQLTHPWGCDRRIF